MDWLFSSKRDNKIVKFSRGPAGQEVCMLKIKEMPVSERPYEKLEKYGAENLSDAELLGIIIKSGVKGENSVQVAQRIINKNIDSKGFYFLERMSINELTEIRGIGKVKAIQLKAIFEMAKRINNNAHVNKVKITTPKLAYEELSGVLKYEAEENFRVLLCDVKCNLIVNKLIAKGSLNTVSIQPREIFKPAIAYSAANILLAHNHPSGDCTPSKEDIIFTKNVMEIGKSLGISVVDHIVIGENGYCSIREEGYLD